MKATFITSIHHGTSNIWTFYFKPEQKLHYLPGQFIELSLDLPPASTDKNRRWFTISSAPSEEYAAVTTRIFSNAVSDFKSTLASLKTGDSVHISEAMGDFVLPKSLDTQLVLIASGIGITPYRSMLKWLIDVHETRRVTLLHVVGDETDQIFDEVFHAYPPLRSITMPNPLPSNTTIIDQLAEISHAATIFISGPEQFVEKLRNDFLAANYEEHQVVCDYFPGYPNA